MAELTMNYEMSGEKVRLGKSDKYIIFNTADMTFPVRAEEVKKNIENYISEIKETEDIEEQIEEIQKSEKYLREQINYLFGYEISDTVFGGASCLTLSPDGDPLYAKFLNAAFELINQQFDCRIAKLKKKVKTYTDKKGMHPAIRK